MEVDYIYVWYECADEVTEQGMCQTGDGMTDPLIMDPATIEQCIIDQSKHKLKLLQEVETCNRTIENLRKLQQLQDDALKNQQL